MDRHNSSEFANYGFETLMTFTEFQRAFYISTRISWAIKEERWLYAASS